VCHLQAANPGAILEDFIRWYSPRDWIEEDGVDEYGQKKGAIDCCSDSSCEVWLLNNEINLIKTFYEKFECCHAFNDYCGFNIGSLITACNDSAVTNSHTQHERQGNILLYWKLFGNKQ
jgi:hypothetical protein